MRKFITQSDEETRKFGFGLGRNFKRGVIALYGELGAGKTTFVQGLAKGLGIKKRIISPTFVIVRTYHLKIKNQKSKIKVTTQNLKTFYHIDLYRIKGQKDFDGLGLTEILSDKNSIVVIEWPEKIRDLLPKERISIYFEYINKSKRRITVKN